MHVSFKSFGLKSSICNTIRWTRSVLAYLYVFAVLAIVKSMLLTQFLALCPCLKISNNHFDSHSK